MRGGAAAGRAVGNGGPGNQSSSTPDPHPAPATETPRGPGPGRSAATSAPPSPARFPQPRTPSAGPEAFVGVCGRFEPSRARNRPLLRHRRAGPQPPLRRPRLDDQGTRWQLSGRLRPLGGKGNDDASTLVQAPPAWWRTHVACACVSRACGPTTARRCSGALSCARRGPDGCGASFGCDVRELRDSSCCTGSEGHPRRRRRRDLLRELAVPLRGPGVRELLRWRPEAGPACPDAVVAGHQC